ncbi:GNAT family N-acetyltransferase [Mycobacterium sp. NPDC050551]|uniref:GNAT family N-acetyltransferase n=1 Tax=Mycobacterium sp. NPDC050551 TaxID=3155407 RepID=UPI003421D2B0
MLGIRAAGADDVRRIAAIFRPVVADGESYAYPEALTDEEIARLWLEPPPGHTIVAVVDGRVVGTAKMGPNRPGRGDHVGTASFMVDPGVQIRGTGRAMAEWVIDWHRRNGYRAIQFNAVVETNSRAVRLWRSLGFDIVGTVPGAFRSRTHGLVGLHVMHLALQT